MLTSQNVKDALALFKNGLCWGKGKYARDCHGNPVAPEDPAAVTFCMLGAGRHIVNREMEWTDLFDQSMPEQVSYLEHRPFVSEFNDDPMITFADVETVFRRAIRALEERESGEV